jgi:predicted HTH transcriptional regulator
MAGRCSSVQRALGLQVKSSVGGLVASFVFAVINTPAFDVHSLWHNNRNTYYIRVGTQSREPSPEELGRLFQQRGLIRAELRPVSGATLNDLDRRRLRDYFSRIRKQAAPPDEDERP